MSPCPPEPSPGSPAAGAVSLIRRWECDTGDDATQFRLTEVLLAVEAALVVVGDAPAAGPAVAGSPRRAALPARSARRSAPSRSAGDRGSCSAMAATLVVAGRLIASGHPSVAGALAGVADALQQFAVDGRHDRLRRISRQATARVTAVRASAGAG